MNFNGVKPQKTVLFDIQRKVVSHKTTASWQHIPHVPFLYEPDITNFYDEFKILSQRKNKQGRKVSFNTIMIKTAIEGLLSAPVLNSYIEYNHKKAEGTIYILSSINISIPWLLKDGRMITPTILNAERMSLDDISDYISNISSRIDSTNIDEMLYRAAYADTIDELKKFNISILRRIITLSLIHDRIKILRGKDRQEYYKIPESKRLTEKDIMSGTVTISNIGSLYKDQRGSLCLLEVIPPQVFAIGIGSVQERPGVCIARNGTREIGIRKILPMCLTFDHRAFDFNSLIPFIKRLDEIFEKPEIIHKW